MNEKKKKKLELFLLVFWILASYKSPGNGSFFSCISPEHNVNSKIKIR